MTAYAVKHLVSKHGPVMANAKVIRNTPYSYTSKAVEAIDAARGNFVYVVEVHREQGQTSYALAYKYKATEAFTRPGALWKDEFKYKNSSTPGDRAVGMYFDSPVEVTSSDFNAWFLGLPPGMTELPAHLASELDSIFDSPASGAARFA